MHFLVQSVLCIKSLKFLLHCESFILLPGDFPHSLACLCLKLLLVIVTGSDNISQNSLLEYLIIHSMFDVLVQVCIYLYA